MDELREALNKDYIAIRGTKNPDRHLYMHHGKYLVIDTSKDEHGEIVEFTDNLDVAIHWINANTMPGEE